MAITNPFSITYGLLTVGGSSQTYLLDGPYVIDKSFERLRLVFGVVVVAGSIAELQTLSDTLELSMRARDVGFSISLDGNEWNYVSGSNALNVRGSAQKTGNRDTDRGLSRAYTCTVEADLPADDQSGLRDLAVNVEMTASRQKTVTMRGVYTANGGSTASEQYLSEFDAEASTLLSGIDGSATFELVAESYTPDRLDHLASFQRQYVQLLSNQSSSGRDDQDIKDHRVTFSELVSQPGDSREGISRLRRLVCTYDCAINIDETQDLQDVWDSKIRQHVLDQFEETFSPDVFAVEDSRVTYDETSKRLSSALQIVYRKSGGQEVLEVAESVAYREVRNIDYTYLHDASEFAAVADKGWSVRERVWSRTVIVMGAETPKKRIGGVTAEAGGAGLFDEEVSGQPGVDARNTGNVERSGWNITSNTSQVTTQWVGDPDGDQFQTTTLTETITERFHEPAEGGTTSGSG